jgi:signal transduction histidine kinase
VTDETSENNPGQRKMLEAAVSAAGHELRNALNGLLVNLEVVRSMAQASGFIAEPFMTQALKQSEESARLAEAAVAMMRLIAGSIGDGDRVSWASAKPGQIGFETGAAAEAIMAALQPLADRGVLSVETSGSTVILRIAEESPNLITE